MLVDIARHSGQAMPATYCWAMSVALGVLPTHQPVAAPARFALGVLSCAAAWLILLALCAWGVGWAQHDPIGSRTALAGDCDTLVACQQGNTRSRRRKFVRWLGNRL